MSRSTRVDARASLAVVGLLWGCGGPNLPVPTTAHVQAAQKQAPQTTLEDLARGRDLYATKCSTCHALRDPASRNREEWDHEIHEMRTEKGARLTDAEHQDILRYLDVASQLAAR